MEGPRRTWSLQEANDALPEIRRRLAKAREALTAARDAEQHLEDLAIVYGDDLEDEANPGHPEWLLHQERLASAQGELEKARRAFREAGTELKDIDAGLVDFYALRGQELVFLCWRDGETRIRAWHRIGEGFAGRAPIGDLMGPAQA